MTDRRPPLEDFLGELDLPDDFCARRRLGSSRRVNDVWRTHEERLQAGVNYITGLMLAFIAVVEDLLDQTGVPSMATSLSRYPPVDTDERGRPVYNLRIDGPQWRISLRRYFDNVGRVAWHELARFDFPNAPGHATRGWRSYRNELDAIFAMRPEERLLLARRLGRSSSIFRRRSSGRRRRQQSDRSRSFSGTFLGRRPASRLGHSFRGLHSPTTEPTRRT